MLFMQWHILGIYLIIPYVKCQDQCSCPIGCQPYNPCSDIFHYQEKPSGEEPNKWYGVLTVKSDKDLQGFWLRLVFDKPPIQVGNYFGEVIHRKAIQNDTDEYLIKKDTLMLKANEAVMIRFYVKYDPSSCAPKLVGARLNGATLCPLSYTTTTPAYASAELQTSTLLSTTTVSPLEIFTKRKPVINDDSYDFFPGDLVARYKLPQVTVSTTKPTLREEEMCGSVVVQPVPLITHGEPTKEGEFPWHASMYHAINLSNLAYVCGGSLISKFYVITAAHCVSSSSSSATLSADKLLIFFGKYYISRWSSAGIQSKGVQSIIRHTQYNMIYNNDIALLKLASPVEFTDYVRPLCLWEDDTDLNSIVHKAATVVGFGFDETGYVTEQLTQAKMPVVSQEECIYSYPQFYSRFTSNKTLCAGFRNGTSACSGDSGGGMVFPKSTSTQERPVWQLRGIVSLSSALQGAKCDTSHYVVFTDVAKYLDWIKATISS